eukprot:1175750-Prorocentrum_minimum.AAC.3
MRTMHRGVESVFRGRVRVMLARPQGRAAGESGELDTGREKGKGLWGVECVLAQEDPSYEVISCGRCTANGQRSAVNTLDVS